MKKANYLYTDVIAGLVEFLALRHCKYIVSDFEFIDNEYNLFLNCKHSEYVYSLIYKYFAKRNRYFVAFFK